MGTVLKYIIAGLLYLAGIWLGWCLIQISKEGDEMKSMEVPCKDCGELGALKSDEADYEGSSYWVECTGCGRTSDQKLTPSEAWVFWKRDNFKRKI